MSDSGVHMLQKHENLKLEIRTKCAGHAMWDLPCLSNVIYAFTLSPQKMIDAFEKKHLRRLHA